MEGINFSYKQQMHESLFNLCIASVRSLTGLSLAVIIYNVYIYNWSIHITATLIMFLEHYSKFHWLTVSFLIKDYLIVFESQN